MTLKQVTAAEFRKNLKIYLDQIQGGEVIEVRGIPIVMYIERGENGGQPAKPMYICDKCKKQCELRKWTEEGMDYKICAICALKSKLPWHKLEPLNYEKISF